MENKVSKKKNKDNFFKKGNTWGSKNARYSRDEIVEILKDALNKARNEPLALYKKDLFKEYDFSYNPYMSGVINVRFKDDKEIQALNSKIDEVIESKVVIDTLRGEINPGFAKFYLINHYKDDFKSKSHIDITSAGSSIGITEDQIDKEVEKVLEKRKAKRQSDV